MFEVIEDLPAGVVGVETKGKITEADFADVLVPAVEQAKAEHGKVRLLYVIGEDLDGLTVGAAWEDLKLACVTSRTSSGSRSSPIGTGSVTRSGRSAG